MQVRSNTSPATSALTTQDTATTATTAKKTSLDSGDFLKLLSVQFQQQDPMKPMEDTAFIAQMAQFSALQQNTTMATQLTQLSANADITAANSYLGHQVTLNDGQGGTVSGQVTGVELASGTPRLVVGDYTDPLSAVLLVEPAASATPAALPPAA